MPVEEHLLKGEKILSSTHAQDGATLHATNRRVIRYKKMIGREEVDALHYSHITAASLKSKSYYWLIIVGVILIIFGILFGQYGTAGAFFLSFVFSLGGCRNSHRGLL